MISSELESVSLSRIYPTVEDCQRSAPSIIWASIGLGIHEATETILNNEASSDAEKGPADSSSSDENTREKKRRKSLGGDGGVSDQEIEYDSEGNAISRTHTVTVDGEVEHQHQNSIGRSGRERHFFRFLDWNRNNQCTQ